MWSRRGSGRRTREAELTEEVQTIRARIRRLEYDNRRLREELTEIGAEMSRLHRELHPTPAGLDRLTGQPNPDDTSPPPATARKRRWPRGTDS